MKKFKYPTIATYVQAMKAEEESKKQVKSIRVRAVWHILIVAVMVLGIYLNPYPHKPLPKSDPTITIDSTQEFLNDKGDIELWDRWNKPAALALNKWL